jgi:transcriptional regulator with XRE-family HTH domain
MFNKNLKNIRSQQGLSQKQVADYLMVSPQSVSKWEKGEALPSIEYLPKLAECLNCDINAFFKPIQEKMVDLNLLGRLLEISYEYIYNQKDEDEEFNAFFANNPNALEQLADLETELKQYQIVKNKTLQRILNCSAEQTLFFEDYFVKVEFMEKLENEDSYFVLKDNIGGLRKVLEVMLIACEYKFK